MSEQLAKTVTAFEQWRSNKSTKGAAIPNPLRQQAVALLPQHSKSTVSRRLRISGAQLKQWCLADKSLDEQAQFIQLPEFQNPSSSLSVDVSFANGNQLSIGGEVNISLITQVIEAIKS